MGSRGPGLAIAGLLLAGGTLFASSAAWATCPGGPTITLSTDKSIQVFRVSDFDPSDTSFHPLVFTLSFCADEAITLALVVSSATDELVSGETKPFTPTGPTTVTNRDLTQTGGQYELKEYHVSATGTALEETIKALSALPTGRDCFEVTMKRASDETPLATSTDCIDVENPTNIQLLRPGDSFGGQAPVVTTAHPQFQWTSNARSFRFDLAEAQPQDASGEDVMEHRPIYSDAISMNAGDPGADPVRGGPLGGIVSFTYPSSAEDLKRGSTYCWQVTARVETSGGLEEMPSQIYCFRRWDASDLAALPVAEALALLLPDLSPDLRSQLEGMTPNGQILLNGAAVDPAVVAEILEGIQSGRLQLISTEIK